MTSDIALSGVACTSGVTPRQLVQSSSENDNVADPLSVHAASQRNVYGWNFKGSRTDAKLLDNRPYLYTGAGFSDCMVRV